MEILLPRDTKSLIETYHGMKTEIDKNKHVAIFQDVINRLHPQSADAEVDFSKMRELLQNIIGQYAPNTKIDIFMQQFNQYILPKRVESIDSKITKSWLNEQRISIINLGGIGEIPDTLDVNIEDKINNKNKLLIGDAMCLPSYFDKNSCDIVIALLLPITQMSGEGDTKEGRKRAIQNVLSGVYSILDISGTSKAYIEFNCNSGDSKVDELELEQIGSTFSFVFENKYPDCPKEHNLYCRKFAYKKNWQENDNEMILYINS